MLFGIHVILYHWCIPLTSRELTDCIPRRILRPSTPSLTFLILRDLHQSTKPLHVILKEEVNAPQHF